MHAGRGHGAEAEAEAEGDIHARSSLLRPLLEWLLALQRGLPRDADGGVAVAAVGELRGLLMRKGGMVDRAEWSGMLEAVGVDKWPQEWQACSSSNPSLHAYPCDGLLKGDEKAASWQRHSSAAWPSRADPPHRVLGCSTHSRGAPGPLRSPRGAAVPPSARTPELEVSPWPHRRCSLWMLFHSLASHTSTEHALQTTHAIRLYVASFFGCEDCASHFGNMSRGMEAEMAEMAPQHLARDRAVRATLRAKPDPTYPSPSPSPSPNPSPNPNRNPTKPKPDPNQARDRAALWMWQAHNHVNARLAAQPDHSFDEFLKVSCSFKMRDIICNL